VCSTLLVEVGNGVLFKKGLFVRSSKNKEYLIDSTFTFRPHLYLMTDSEIIKKQNCKSFRINGIWQSDI
jgi:hypothetical protein